MTLQEVIKELRSRNKPYLHSVPQMEQGYFSRMLSNIETGISKPKTTREFLAKFGYEVDREVLYKRIDN